MSYSLDKRNGLFFSLLMIGIVWKPQNGSCLTLFPEDSKDAKAVEYEKSSNMALEISGTWWTLGVIATALLFGSLQLDAIAADESVTAAVTAASREAPA